VLPDLVTGPFVCAVGTVHCTALWRVKSGRDTSHDVLLLHACLSLQYYRGLGQKVSRVFYYIWTKLLSRMLWSSASRPLRSVERTCVRIGLSRSRKNIELVRSDGRVTDTSSAETNLASHVSSCAWRLHQGVEASRSSSLRASRAASPLRRLCRIMLRYVSLVSQRPKPLQVLRRKRAASALSTTTECLPAAAKMM
jgi:hypothetical protein